MRADASSTSKRKRRRGFYDHHLTKGEITELKRLVGQGEAASLQDEIGLLRVMIRRLMELAQEIGTLDEALSTVRTLSAAASKLAGLLKMQKELEGKEDDPQSALSRALAEVAEELAAEAKENSE